MYNINAISMSAVIFLNNRCQCNFTQRRYSFFEKCNTVEGMVNVYNVLINAATGSAHIRAGPRYPRYAG